MRFLRGLLLVLFLLPAGALLAPCCAEAIEACCPLDRACEEGEACPGTTAPSAAVPCDVAPALPPAAPLVAIAPTTAALPAALTRTAFAPTRIPLRN